MKRNHISNFILKDLELMRNCDLPLNINNNFVVTFTLRSRLCIKFHQCEKRFEYCQDAQPLSYGKMSIFFF